jgi:hypothetical protein
MSPRRTVASTSGAARAVRSVSACCSAVVTSSRSAGGSASVGDARLRVGEPAREQRRELRAVAGRVQRDHVREQLVADRHDAARAAERMPRRTRAPQEQQPVVAGHQREEAAAAARAGRLEQRERRRRVALHDQRRRELQPVELGRRVGRREHTRAHDDVGAAQVREQRGGLVLAAQHRGEQQDGRQETAHGGHRSSTLWRRYAMSRSRNA